MSVKRLAGWLLLAVSAFMVLGFLRVGTMSIAALVALAIGAGIPGGAGIALLRGSRARPSSSTAAALRRQTLESEILRLASRAGGKLTVVEVVADLAITADEAKAVVDGLAVSEVAELQITESGGIVYDFPDVRLLREKNEARGVLDD